MRDVRTNTQMLQVIIEIKQIGAERPFILRRLAVPKLDPEAIRARANTDSSGDATDVSIAPS